MEEKAGERMILMDDRQDKCRVTLELKESIKKIADYALKCEGVNCEYEISLIFIDNKEIERLNSEFRNIKAATDVLSFPMLEYSSGEVFKEIYNSDKLGEEMLDDGKLVLGDIAISLERANEQCKEYGHPFLREVCYLTVHSLLHLLGYDHMEDIQKSIMRKREEEILNAFDIRR
jgi:probable rRNA maturation factor